MKSPKPVKLSTVFLAIYEAGFCPNCAASLHDRASLLCTECGARFFIDTINETTTMLPPPGAQRRKNKHRIVTIDMSDQKTNDKLLQISAFILAILMHTCESAVEAYTVCHLVKDMLGKRYDIAGAEDVHMPTDKIQ